MFCVLFQSLRMSCSSMRDKNFSGMVFFNCMHMDHHNHSQNQTNLKPSLTVAIPAYNEENMIGDILQSLLAQEQNNFTFDKIVVYADACTDRTAERVREAQEESSLIYILENADRRGKVRQLNFIFRDNSSDFLLILDADIALRGRNFLDIFVSEALLDSKNVMFAAHQIPLRPESIAGRIFHSSFLAWDYIRLSIPDRSHVHNFYGAATLYRKDFVRSLSIPKKIREMRSYLYLMSVRKGGFRYVDSVAIFYWPPHTLIDFMKLRKRAFGSDGETLRKIFGNEAMNMSVIRWKYKLIGMAKFAREYPLYVVPAVILNWLLGKLTQRRSFDAQISSIWETADSTKKRITLHKGTVCKKKRS